MTDTTIHVSAAGSTDCDSQPRTIYNAGNDDIGAVNRFTFPAISFSPSLPSENIRSPALVNLSPSGRHSELVESETAISMTSHLSPPTSSKASSKVSSPSSVQRSSTLSSISPASLLSIVAPSSPASPLPPLSPRGQKLADAERIHKLKCMNRIVEKRRKASDGIRDIITYE